jgi:hypothetical protein
MDALSSGECHVLGCGLPVCDTKVALLVKIAPAEDAAIFVKAAEDPVRGPEALYTQVSSGIPPTLVARLGMVFVGLWRGSCRYRK